MRKQNRQIGIEYENWGSDWSSDHRVFITGGQGFRVDNQTGKTFCIGEVDKTGLPLTTRQDLADNSADNTGLIKKCDMAESRLNTQPLPDVTVDQGCCKACGKPLPPGVRQDTRYCSTACRQRASGKSGFND